MAIYPITRPETRSSGVSTTDATVTTICRVPVRKNEAHSFEATVTGIRTGGSGGTAGDAVSYKLIGFFRDNSGTMEQIGSTVKTATEVDSSWDADFAASGMNVLIRVTGEASVNIKWRCDVTISRLK